MSGVLAQALTGLAGASALFLVAAGLTVIFGVTRIVNFAHGGLAMLGAYVGWSLLSRWGTGPGAFVGGVLATGVVVAAVGAGLEVVVLRRIYRAPEMLQFLATFGVVLVLRDAVQALWGAEELTLPRAGWMRGFVMLAGARFPLFDLVLIGVGPVVLGGLVWLFRATRFGMRVRAATTNREMLAALGVSQRLLFTAVFALGAGLAGVAGVLMLPEGSANTGLDASLITDAFVVVVVGGLGSLGGAYLAAVLIGELRAFGILLLPGATLVLVFVVMAVVLVLWPNGLMGAAVAAPVAGEGFAPVRRGGVGWIWAGAAVSLVLPLVLGPFGVAVLTEMWVAVLFAASLHLLMGPGGVASFGHAAWFGLGAYAAALAGLAGWGMPAALLVAAVVAGGGAVLFGCGVARLSGVYLAMVTLAVAQILWAGAVQWVGVSGGDNGLLNLRAGVGEVGMCYLALVLGGGGALVLRGVMFSHFGYALRGVRDSAARAAAIGLDARRLRVGAFGIAGAAAGLAGGVFAFAKGAVFPESLGIERSMDGLVMVLLGGVQSVAGPILGGVAYTVLYDALLGSAFWRAKLGVLIVLLVVLLPDGLAGRRR